MNPSAPNRRDFLQAAAATALVPLMLSPSVMAAPPSRRPWKWAPEPGLWETVCGDDVAAQLHATADAGFAAFADPDLLQRTSTQRESLRFAAQQHGMKLGPVRYAENCFLNTDDHAEIGKLMISSWRSEVVSSAARLRHLDTHQGRARIAACLRHSIQRWKETLQTKWVAGLESATTTQKQTRHGVSGAAKTSPQLPMSDWPAMLVEPIVSHATDQRWYQHFAEIVHEVSHPQCRLSVDTYRLASAGIDVVAYMQRHAAIIGHVELADYPGGFEPGSGTLDIEGIVAATALFPYEGVVGLRCGLSRPGQAGLGRLIAAARHHGGLSEEFLI